MSTPILNPPQSGILGMHKIQERPMAVGGKVEIRPMMYVALTYDHRIVDGSEAVIVPGAREGRHRGSAPADAGRLILRHRLDSEGRAPQGPALSSCAPLILRCHA